MTDIHLPELRTRIELLLNTSVVQAGKRSDIPGHGDIGAVSVRPGPLFAFDTAGVPSGCVLREVSAAPITAAHPQRTQKAAAAPTVPAR